MLKKMAITPITIEPMQLCVAFHRKLRIRLHPSMELICGIASNNG